MDLKLFATVFATIFLAELGDKTQIATFLFASRTSASLLTVFLAASLALLAATGIAIAAGSLVAEHINEKYLAWAAGVGFILIGLWTILRA